MKTNKIAIILAILLLPLCAFAQVKGIEEMVTEDSVRASVQSYVQEELNRFWQEQYIKPNWLSDKQWKHLFALVKKNGVKSFAREYIPLLSDLDIDYLNQYHPDALLARVQTLNAIYEGYLAKRDLFKIPQEEIDTFLDIYNFLKTQVPPKDIERRDNKLIRIISQNCPLFTRNQVMEAADKKVYNSQSMAIIAEDVRCYKKAQLKITYDGGRKNPEEITLEDSAIFFYRERQYDDGYSWDEWKVVAYTMDMNALKYIHEFDENTDVITLTDLSNSNIPPVVYKSSLIR